MVFGVMWLQEQTPKDMFLRDWIVDWNMIIIMGSIVNMILGKGGKGYMIIQWAWESSLWRWLRYTYELQNLWG